MYIYLEFICVDCGKWETHTFIFFVAAYHSKQVLFQLVFRRCYRFRLVSVSRRSLLVRLFHWTTCKKGCKFHLSVRFTEANFLELLLWRCHRVCPKLQNILSNIKWCLDKQLTSLHRWCQFHHLQLTARGFVTVSWLQSMQAEAFFIALRKSFVSEFYAWWCMISQGCSSECNKADTLAMEVTYQTYSNLIIMNMFEYAWVSGWVLEGPNIMNRLQRVVKSWRIALTQVGCLCSRWWWYLY